MEIHAFLLSLATSVAAFLLLLWLHSSLAKRPSHYPVYYSAHVDRGDPTFEKVKARSDRGWLRGVLFARKDDIAATAGIDAVVYISFQEAAFEILSLSALFCLPVLVTAAALSGNRSQKTETPPRESARDASLSGFDSLGMANIPEGSPKMWLFVVGAYWVSAVTYSVLLRQYRRLARMRCQELVSGKQKPEHIAAVVRNIPRHLANSSSDVDAYFRRLYPDGAYVSCLLSSEATRREKILRRANRLATQMKAAKDRRARCSPTATHLTGWFGLWGKRVQSKAFYEERIGRLEDELSAELQSAVSEAADSNGGLRSRFQTVGAVVFFRSRFMAAVASQCHHSVEGGTWITVSAPDPNDLIFSNLNMPVWQRQIYHLMIDFLVAAIILFYLVPIGLITALVNLQSLEEKFPSLRPMLEVSWLSTFIEAYLPQFVLICILALLPTVLHFLSSFEGFISRSQIQRAGARKYFYFNVLNVFIGVTLSNSLFDILKDLQNASPKAVIALLGESIPKAASFFVTFISLRFLLSSGLRLLRIWPLFLFYFNKSKYTNTTRRSPDEISAENSSAGNSSFVKSSGTSSLSCSFAYHELIPNDLLIFTIAISYAVIAPMILPCGMAYFAILWCITRHEALNIVVPKYETDGQFWPHTSIRMICSLLISQITMVGYFGTKQFRYSPFLIPLPLMSLAFLVFVKRTFTKTFSVMPLEAAAAADCLNKSGEAPALEIDFLKEAYNPTNRPPNQELLRYGLASNQP